MQKKTEKLVAADVAWECKMVRSENARNQVYDLPEGV